MKTPVLGSAFFTLLALVLSHAGFVHASPSPADSLHFCRPLDFQPEQVDSHAAAKRLADLDTGEPPHRSAHQSIAEQHRQGEEEGRGGRHANRKKVDSRCASRP